MQAINKVKQSIESNQKLEESIKQLEEGKVVVKTMEELEEMANE